MNIKDLNSILPMLEPMLGEETLKTLETAITAYDMLSKVVPKETTAELKKLLSRIHVEYVRYKGEKCVAIIIEKEKEQPKKA